MERGTWWSFVLAASLAAGTPTQDPAEEKAVQELLAREVLGQPAPDQEPAEGRRVRPDPLDALVRDLETGIADLRHRDSAATKASRTLNELGVLALPALYRNLAELNAFGLRNALDLLVRFPEPRLYEVLAAMLQGEEPSRRLVAARILHELPTEPARPLVELAAQDRSPLVRLGAIRARLGERPARETVAALRPFVGSDHAGVREEVQHLLEEPALRGDAVRELLAEVARTEDDQWAHWAARTWIRKTPREAEDEALAFFASLASRPDVQESFVSGVYHAEDRAPWPRVLAAGVGRTEGNETEWILERLARSRVAPSVAVVEDLLGRGSVRDAAIRFVLSRGERWAPTVERLLVDPLPYGNGDSRGVAAFWLRKHAPRRLLEHAEVAIEAGDRDHVLAVLVQHGRPEDVGLAARLLRTGSTDDPLRYLIAHRSRPQDLDALLDLVRLPTPRIPDPVWEETMDAVATAVQRWFGAGQVEPALERLFEVDGYLAERLLGEIQRVAEARHVPLLRAVLEPAAARAEEGDWPEASEPLPAAAALGPLIGTLARIGGEPARSGLRSLLGEAQPWIRDEALRALLGMDGTDADAVLRDALAEEQPVEVLQVALEHPRTATDDGLRARTVERLRSLPDGAEVDLSTWFSRLAPQARTSTAETLLVRDEPHAAPPAVVVQALGVLGDAPDPDIAELARWLRAEDARVRQAAVEQLGRTYDRAAVPHLIEALKDADAEVYDAAEDALQRFETFFEQRRRWQGLGKDG